MSPSNRYITSSVIFVGTSLCIKWHVNLLLHFTLPYFRFTPVHACSKYFYSTWCVWVGFILSLTHLTGSRSSVLPVWGSVDSVMWILNCFDFSAKMNEKFALSGQKHSSGNQHQRNTFSSLTKHCTANTTTGSSNKPSGQDAHALSHFRSVMPWEVGCCLC